MLQVCLATEKTPFPKNTRISEVLIVVTVIKNLKEIKPIRGKIIRYFLIVWRIKKKYKTD